MPRSRRHRSVHQRQVPGGQRLLVCRCGNRFPTTSPVITQCGRCYRRSMRPQFVPPVEHVELPPGQPIWIEAPPPPVVPVDVDAQLRQVLDASVHDAHAFADPHALPHSAEPEVSGEDEPTIADRLQELLTTLGTAQQHSSAFKHLHQQLTPDVIEHFGVQQEIDDLVQGLEDLKTQATAIHSEAEELCSANTCSICMDTIRERAAFTGCGHSQFCMSCAQTNARVQQESYEPVSCPICRTEGSILKLHM